MLQANYLDTETAYWLIPAEDAFSVEVVTLWEDPTTVGPFATAADAKVWIAEQRREVQSEGELSRYFQAAAEAGPVRQGRAAPD